MTGTGPTPGPTPGPAPGVRRRIPLPYLLLLPAAAWLLLFFVAPLIYQASTSLQTGNIEDGYRVTWHFATYADALADYGPQFLRSLLYALAATVLCLLIAYPLAYTLAFKAGRWRNVMLVMIVAPFFTSFLIRTLAWKTILADHSPVTDALRGIGVLAATDALGLTRDDRLLATPLAVICGLTYNFLPFMVLPLYASLERIDNRLHEASRDLYASAFTTFRRVTFPLSLPGVVAGTLLTFIPASGDYINSQLLGSSNEAMIGNIVQSQFLRVLDYPTAAALSFVLMASILVMVLTYIRRAGTEEVV
jgi:spermidine/putrescine transport system permease protein